MSFKVLERCMTNATVKSTRDRAALFILAHFSGENGICWPSTKTIAQRMCVHRSTAIDAIASLSKTGAVSVYKRKGRSNLFIVCAGLDESMIPAAAVECLARGGELQEYGERRTGHGKLSARTNNLTSSDRPDTPLSERADVPGRNVPTEVVGTFQHDLIGTEKDRSFDLPAPPFAISLPAQQVDDWSEYDSHLSLIHI